MKDRDLELLEITPVDYILATEMQRKIWRKELKEIKKQLLIDDIGHIAMLILFMFVLWLSCCILFAL